MIGPEMREAMGLEPEPCDHDWEALDERSIRKGLYAQCRKCFVSSLYPIAALEAEAAAREAEDAEIESMFRGLADHKRVAERTLAEVIVEFIDALPMERRLYPDCYAEALAAEIEKMTEPPVPASEL